MTHLIKSFARLPLVLVALTVLPATAGDNPFVPSSDGPSAFELERRIGDLERQSEMSSYRFEELLQEQLPSIQASLLRGGEAIVQEGISVFGEVNGQCIGRKTLDSGQTTLIRLADNTNCMQR